MRRAVLTALLLAPLLAFDASAQQQARTYEIVKLADGFGITEGPYWHKDGYLLFVDVTNSRIHRWSESKGVEVVREPSGRANGIGVAANGDLIVAQRDRRLSRLTADGKEVLLAERFEGKRLNSPNDVALRSDGSIYFTDPTFGVRRGEAELTHKGVYRVGPDGSLQLLADDFNMPNGLAFSPDEKRLYVNDSAAKHMRVFDVNADGTLSNSRVFAVLQDSTKKGDPDGLKVDARGNIYSAGPGGVWVFAPDGTLIQRIEMPEEHTTNLTLASADGSTLYVTGVSHVGEAYVGRVYRVRASQESQ